MDDSEETGNTAHVLSLPLLMLVGVAFLCGLYDKGLNAGLPLYYERLGYPATIGGTLVAIYTLSSTITRLIGGKATDRFEHMRVILVSMAFLLVGVALPVICDAFAVVVIARVFQGAGFALSANVISVIMQGLVPKGHLGEAVGLKGTGASLSVMFGAMIATFLLDSFDFRIFFAFYIGIMVVSTVMVALLPRTKAFKRAAALDKTEKAQTSARASETGATRRQSSKGRDIKGIFQSFLIPGIYPTIAVSFAHRIVRGLCISFVLVYAHFSHVGSGPIWFVVAGIGTLVMRLAGGRFYDKAAPWWLLPMVGLNMVGFLALALFPCVETFYFSAACYGLSVGSSSAFLKTIAARIAPKRQWGIAVGELFFAGDIGLALGAFMGGVLIDAFGRAAFPGIGLGFNVFATVVTLVVIFLVRRYKK